MILNVGINVALSLLVLNQKHQKRKRRQVLRRSRYLQDWKEKNLGFSEKVFLGFYFLGFRLFL